MLDNDFLLGVLSLILFALTLLFASLSRFYIPSLASSLQCGAVQCVFPSPVCIVSNDPTKFAIAGWTKARSEREREKKSLGGIGGASNAESELPSIDPPGDDQ